MSSNPSTQIVKVPEKIMSVFEDSETVKQFEAILHAGTNAFVKSALIAIAASPDLMNCSPASLATGTLRSATLGLSLDPALRQAYLVPRPLQGIWTACFQPHYHGLYDLAVRTNKYRTISVQPIYPGEQILEDPRTGMHYISSENSNFIYKPHRDVQGFDSGYRDVTSGRNTAAAIGFFGYFLTVKGFEKTVYMTIKEIHAHALLWSPASYNSEKGAWQDRKKVPIMEMKTVFIALSKFMDLSGEDNSKLRGAVDDVKALEEEPITVMADDAADYPEAEPAELPIESAAPGPQKSKAVVNESISDGEWERFSKLVQQAANAGIVVRDYNRSKMTAELINGATIYLRQAIEKAKA